MNKILAIGAALFLSGCVTTTQPPTNLYHVVLAPESMYYCPVVKQWPEVKTLTDLKVARVLVQLAENNRICKASLDALHAYYAEAAARFSK